MAVTLESCQDALELSAIESPEERFGRLFLDDSKYGPAANTIFKAIERGDRTAAAYITLFPNLLSASSEFATIFPEEVSPGVEEGSRALLSDALFAVAHHTDNANHTVSQVELRGGKCLAVELAGSQPAELLASLGRSMRRITEVVKDPEIPVVASIATSGFRVYRFVDIKRPGKPAVHAYVRPEGSELFDPTFEYGRSGIGVEASISLVTDTRSGEALSGRPFLGEITKKHYGSRPDNRISLRLDREGVSPEERELMDGFHHPQLPKGTLAYDTGSVLGAETMGALPLGTRIGRLLAWGNTLSAITMGKLPGLNHSVDHFDAQLGRDDVFASHALTFEASFQERLLSRQALSTLMIEEYQERQS